MIKNKLNLFLWMAVILSQIILSCTNPKRSEEQNETVDNDSINSPVIITLSKADSSQAFPAAKLMEPQRSVVPTDTGFVVNYTFGVERYELGVQTTDAATRGIANSEQGQHIHFIVNNGPYAAHYMSEINNQLSAGNYVVLAFLSRSYHESLKNKEAFFIENLTVGDVDPQLVDISAPHLFYSRPKGTYKGKDTEKILLDFYLVNTDLSSEGNQMQVLINGDEFLIDEWTPYFIEGLPMGEATIQMQLQDADGNPIEGPYNSITRTIMLEN